ncbi:MAG: endonuclease [Methanosarcinaceae archaeon]
MKSRNLADIYDKLLQELGPQEWWPADTPFEVVIGAILTQQTRWTNVETAISDLKGHGLADPQNLANANPERIEELVQRCGFYHQKASRLRNIAQFFVDNPMDIVFTLPVGELRELMLSLQGVGYETADSIILYAADRPKFVIDAYTTRMMKCIGIEGNYMQLQQLFEEQLPADVKMFKEYHALIVEYAKKYCGKKRCDACPLIQGVN